MPVLQMQMHPGVERKTGTHFQRNPSAYLSQGQLTSSCGLTAILMATIILGIATKSYVRQLRFGIEGDLLMPLWTKAQETFFLGTDHDEMLGLLGTLDRYVRYQAQKGSVSNVIGFTLDRLARNELVVLGFGSADASGPDHWALAVGVMSHLSKSRGVPTGVLCLDSALARPGLAPFNARLELDSPKRGARQLHYRGEDGRAVLMTATSAISISKR